MKLRFLHKYFMYLLKSKSGQKFQISFVDDFVKNVLDDRRHYPEYREVDKVRAQLFNNDNVIEIVDFGAESQNKAFKTYSQKISSIAKRRSHPLKYGHLLFRMARYFQPETILEFGTSTGLSSMYLASGAPKARLLTLEGCASLASVASEKLQSLKLDHVEVMIGNFNVLLPGVLQKLDRLDMVFFDGNHRKKPTLEYFEKCLEKTHADSVFIFDDIYWSAEMEHAWKLIKENPKVTASLDLFFFGLVFFKQDIQKKHLKLRF